MRNRFLVVLALLVGCDVNSVDSGDGGQFGEENRGCEEVDRTSVALDDDTLGFDGQSILDLAGSHTLPLEYTNGDLTDLSIAVIQTDGGAVDLVEYQYFDESGQEIASADCVPQLEVEVEVEFATEDGVFDEQWSDLLVASVAGEAYLFEDLTDLNGSFDPWDYAPDGNDFDEMAASVDIAFTAVGLSGAVMAVGTGSDGEGDDGTVFAEAVLIGSFGADEGGDDDGGDDDSGDDE